MKSFRIRTQTTVTRSQLIEADSMEEAQELAVQYHGEDDEVGTFEGTQTFVYDSEAL